MEVGRTNYRQSIPPKQSNVDPRTLEKYPVGSEWVMIPQEEVRSPKPNRCAQPAVADLLHAVYPSFSVGFE